jgi:hypothetical protein
LFCVNCEGHWVAAEDSRSGCPYCAAQAPRPLRVHAAPASASEPDYRARELAASAT